MPVLAAAPVPVLPVVAVAPVPVLPVPVLAVVAVPVVDVPASPAPPVVVDVVEVGVVSGATGVVYVYALALTECLPKYGVPYHGVAGSVKSPQ